MLAASLALTIAWAQAPPRVTVVTDCENAARVVARLAQSSGQRLEVGGSVKQDWLAIKFTDVSIEDAKARLAAALDAEWLLRSDGVFELTRSPEFLRRRAQERRQALAAQIRKAQAEMKIAPPVTSEEAEKLVREVFRQGEFMTGENRYERISEFNNRTPSQRLADRLLVSLDAEWIANNADSDNGCWLTLHGRGRIFSLPSSSRALIQEYLTEQQAVDIAVSRSGLVRNPRAPVLGIYRSPGTTSVNDVRIGVNVILSDSDVVLYLEMYTPQVLERMSDPESEGDAEVLAYASLDFTDDSTAFGEGDLGTDARLPISLDFDALMAPVYQLFEPAANAALPPRTAEIFRDLVTHDPLTILTQSAIRAEFERAPGDRIIVLPDMFEPFLVERDELKSLTSREMWTNILDASDLRQTEVLGTQVVRPAIDGFARTGRWPRQAMSDFFRRAMSGVITIEDVASLIESGNDESMELAVLLPLWATDSDLYAVSEFPDLTPYRLFAALNRNQRAAAQQAGVRLRISELSTETRKFLEALIVEPNEILDPITARDEGQEPTPADYLFDRGGAFLFAEGFPADGFLELRVNRVERFFVRYDGMVEAADLENLASMIVYREHITKAKKSEPWKFEVARTQVEEVSFGLRFPQLQRQLEGTACLEIPITPRKYGPSTDLPADVRRRLDAAIAKARAEIGGGLLRENHR